MRQRPFTFLIVLGIGLLVISYLFKIMHWPGARQMGVVGYAFLATFYPRQVFQGEKRTVLNSIKALSFFLWAGLAAIYLIFIEDNYQFLRYLSLLFLCVWIAVFFYQMVKREDREEKVKPFELILFILGALFVVTGFFFRIFHYPGGGILLTIGIILVAIWYYFSLQVEQSED